MGASCKAHTVYTSYIYPDWWRLLHMLVKNLFIACWHTLTLLAESFQSQTNFQNCCYNCLFCLYSVGSFISVDPDPLFNQRNNLSHIPIYMFVAKPELPAIHHIKREGMCGKSQRISCLWHVSALPTHQQPERLSCEDLCMCWVGAWYRPSMCVSVFYMCTLSLSICICALVDIWALVCVYFMEVSRFTLPFI